MRVFHEDGRAVALERRHFVGQGGEGRVYAFGERAYKIAHDPARALSAGRLAALAALEDPRILAPEGRVFDEHGAAVGHFGPFAPDTHPLCRLFARSFRQQHHVGPQQLFGLLAGMREVVAHAHERGLQIGDLNPLNILVDADLATPRFIDVDSWQAPGFPVTAVMDAVRDRHAPGGQFDERTDWFAFAVLTFQLLIGLHPYRGGHPVKGLDARMKANISALRPDVVRPPSCSAPSALPRHLRGWLEAVLEEGARQPLPWLALAEAAPESLAAPLACPAPAAPPLRATIDAGRLRLFDATCGDHTISVTLAATQVVVYDGRAYALAGDRIVEVTIRRMGGATLAVPRVVASTLPLATRLYPGVAVQDLLGATHVTAFVGPGRAVQLPVPGVAARQIVDASFDGCMVSLLVAQPDGRQERKSLGVAR